MATNASLSQPTTTSTRLRASLWMLGASVCFALMAALVKLSVEHGVPLGQTLFYRGLINFILAYLFLRWAGVPLATSHWKAQLQRGIAGVIGLAAYFGGIALLPLATAVTLNYTSPLLLTSMLLVMHNERPPKKLVMALFGGFAGIVLLLRPSYDSSQLVGGLIALGSAVTTALAALNIRSLGRLDEPITRTVAYYSLIITIGSLPWYLASNPTQIDLVGAAYLLGIALVATVGQSMMTLAYQRGNTLLVSLLGYSQVVLSSLFGVALWGDHLDVISWFAIALIFGSGLAATKFARTPEKAAAD